jgi:hypothetical protein
MKTKLFFIAAFFIIGLSAKTQSIIQAQTGNWSNGGYQWTDETVYLDTTKLSYWSCCEYTSGLKFVVIAANSCTPWTSSGIGHSYEDSLGSYHCQPFTTKAFDFFISASPDSMNKIANFINSIPQNDYVLVMTHFKDYCTQWNSNLVNAFQTIGGSSSYSTSNGFNDSIPYILFGLKGAVPGSRHYTIGNASGGLINQKDTLPCTPNSIKEINSENQISIFPNPVSSTINIEVLQKSTIELLNIQGQTILQQTVQQGKTDIDIGGLAKGVYILRLCSNDKTEVTKIVKE